VKLKIHKALTIISIVIFGLRFDKRRAAMLDDVAQVAKKKLSLMSSNMAAMTSHVTKNSSYKHHYVIGLT
jgi:hypothetical protein